MEFNEAITKNPSLPHRLEPSAKETWHIELSAIQYLVNTDGKQRKVWMRVDLGPGKVLRTKQRHWSSRRSYARPMPTDLNDVDALIGNLVDSFRKAVIKGVRVRVDENGEMFVTHEGVERAHVSATGVTAEIDGEKVISKPPLSDLLTHAGESEADAAKRVLDADAGGA